MCNHTDDEDEFDFPPTAASVHALTCDLPASTEAELDEYQDLQMAGWGDMRADYHAHPTPADEARWNEGVEVWRDAIGDALNAFDAAECRAALATAQEVEKKWFEDTRHTARCAALLHVEV